MRIVLHQQTLQHVYSTHLVILITVQVQITEVELGPPATFKIKTQGPANLWGKVSTYTVRVIVTVIVTLTAAVIAN